MIVKLSRVIPVFTVVLVVCTASASAGGYSAYETINKMWVGDGKYYMVGQTYSNPDNCSTSYKAYVLSSEQVADREMRDAIYSGALAAWTSRSKVRFYLNGCDGNGYPRVRILQFEPDTS